MTSTEPQEDIFLNTFSLKKDENAIKLFLTFEYYFLTNHHSLNPSKLNPKLRLTFSLSQNYFPYPMIITKYLLKAFDKSNSDSLSLDDYISGFQTIYSGSSEERAKLFFRLFNVNNDNYVHIEDVRCMLRYCHVFYNKENMTALENTINHFFGSNKLFNKEDFIKRCHRKNSGFLMIILAIFFENKTASTEVLELIQDFQKFENRDNINEFEQKQSSNYSSKLTHSHKKQNSKFVNHAACYSNKSLVMVTVPESKSELTINQNEFPKFNTNVDKNHTLINEQEGVKKEEPNSQANQKAVANSSVLQIVPPKEIALEYLHKNFNVTFKKDQRSGANNPGLYGSPNNLMSFLVNNGPTQISGGGGLDDSMISTCQDEIEEEFEDDLDFLRMFDVDLYSVRADMLEQYCYMNQYAIPKGSMDFDIKSGVIHSRIDSNRKMSSLSTKTLEIHGGGGQHSFREQSQHENISPKNNFRGGRSNFKDQKQHNSTNALLIVPNIGKQKYFQHSVVDYLNEQKDSIDNFANSFEEDILMIKKKQNILKKYSLLLINGFIFILKKKQTQIPGNTTDYNSLGAKFFIPTKHLYIGSVDHHFVFEGNEYINVTLESTVFFKRKTYAFLFTSKVFSNQFVHLFCHLTKYHNIESDYNYVKDVGKGSFCQMKLMRHIQSGKLYAIKKIKKESKSLEEFTTLNWEKDIVSFLINFPDTSHILKCYKILETLENIYIVTEYIAGGSLSAYIRKNKIILPSTIVMKILTQIVHGLGQLHKYGIVHRDMKLENILMDYTTFDNFTAKVIDFGLSQVLTPLSRTSETYGTLIYCSPEILLSMPYDFKVDIWSLGIILFYLEYTFMPFNIRGREPEQEISNKIITNELRFPKKVDSNGNEKEVKANQLIMTVIKQCLLKDINKRPSCEQIEYYLSK